MKTIRSILEEVMNYGANEFIQSPKRPQLTINQALAEIEKVMNECKPVVTSDMTISYGGVKWSSIGLLDTYQSNLHKALGKE